MLRQWIFASVIAGMDARQLRTLSEEHITSHIFPRIFPSALQLIEWHKQAGHEVYLVSSAPDEIVSEMARLLGLSGAIGTTAEVQDGHYTGKILRFCHGATKATAIEELARSRNINLKRSVAYSDSISDVPMLSAVGRAVCVNPDKKLQEYAGTHGWMSINFPGRRRTIRHPRKARNIAAPLSMVRPGADTSPFEL